MKLSSCVIARSDRRKITTRFDQDILPLPSVLLDREGTRHASAVLGEIERRGTRGGSEQSGSDFLPEFGLLFAPAIRQRSLVQLLDIQREDRRAFPVGAIPASLATWKRAEG